MAMSRKVHGNKGKKRGQISTICASTQTEDLKTSCVYPRVIIQRLPQEISSNSTTFSKKNGHDSIQAARTQSSIITAKTSRLSRIPVNYSGFVKPINNKEQANSTLATDPIDEENRTRSLAAQISINNNNRRKVHFLKPGPLSYKRRLLEENEESMRIPVALAEPKESSAMPNLETIMEQLNEDTSTPDFININVDTEQVEDILNSGTQDQCMHIENSAENILENNINSTPPARKFLQGNKDDEPKEIRLQYEGITTVITTKSSSQIFSETSDENDDESAKEENSKPKRSKFVKINAQTVHIHNHFYNS